MNETCEQAEKFLSEIVTDLGFDLTVKANWTDEGCLLDLSGSDSHLALAENGELLDLSATDDRARARELAQARVAALDEKIAELHDAREALAGLATACAKKRSGPCPILSAFDRG